MVSEETRATHTGMAPESNLNEKPTYSLSVLCRISLSLSPAGGLGFGPRPPLGDDLHERDGRDHRAQEQVAHRQVDDQHVVHLKRTKKGRGFLKVIDSGSPTVIVDYRNRQGRKEGKRPPPD